MIGAFAFTGPLSIVCLGLGGFMLLSTIPVIVAMAQELVPGQTSTVSALMMGAAWGVGALAPQALSGFVPAFGFRNVLIFASAVTMVTAVLAYLLRVTSQFTAELLSLILRQQAPSATESGLSTAASSDDTTNPTAGARSLPLGYCTEIDSAPLPNDQSFRQSRDNHRRLARHRRRHCY